MNLDNNEEIENKQEIDDSTEVETTEITEEHKEIATETEPQKRRIRIAIARRKK